MKTLLSAFLFGVALVPIVGVDQEIVISGTIVDSGGSAIASAQVLVVGRQETAIAAPDGTYRLVLADDRLAGTTVIVRARALGFATQSQSVVMSSSAVEVNFVMAPSVVALDEVVVNGVATPAEQLGVVKRAQASARVDAMRVRQGPVYSYGNREQYAHIVENDFRRVLDEPLSTFSIDVDRASYSNVRRFVSDGVRPPIDAVRVEELINYFPYDYTGGDGEHPFGVTTEIMRAPWNPNHYLARVGLQAEAIAMEDAPPSNLVFLLDVSGSMSSPDKLPLLKRSMRLLVNELRDNDRVAIVVYAGRAGLVLPSTSGARKGDILAAIERLESGGSTAGGAGIRLAYQVAQENHIRGGNNRVILATDGDFNVGASSDADMIRLIERKREQGTFLTVLGFGTGNLQDAKMEQIADHGNGNFAYIDNLLEARKVLVTEMGGTLLTVAKDVKLQVEFNPAHVRGYRLIGYENRLLAAEDFNNDAKDAGELGAGHSVTALYEVVPVTAPMPGEGSVDSLRYQEPRPDPIGASSDEWFFVKVRYKQPDGERSTLLQVAAQRTEAPASDDLRFAAAVAGFGMILRESEHCADWTLEDVSSTAMDALGDDRHGYRADFVRMVEDVRDKNLLATR